MLVINNIKNPNYPRIKHNGNYYMISFKEETDMYYILTISGSIGDSIAKRMKYGFPIFISRTILNDDTVVITVKNDKGNTFDEFFCLITFLGHRNAFFNKIIEKCVNYLK